MKSGSGDDPFADPFAEEESSAETDSETPAEAAESTEQEPDAVTDTTSTNGALESVQTTAAEQSESTSDKPDDSHIPWVLRRSSVKDDRPNITQFFLRDETDRAERRLRSDVEEILDKDVYTLDLREAAYLVAMQHPDEIAETLREWGYDYLD